MHGENKNQMRWGVEVIGWLTFCFFCLQRARKNLCTFFFFFWFTACIINVLEIGSVSYITFTIKERDDPNYFNKKNTERIRICVLFVISYLFRQCHCHKQQIFFLLCTFFFCFCSQHFIIRILYLYYAYFFFVFVYITLE